MQFWCAKVLSLLILQTKYWFLHLYYAGRELRSPIISGHSLKNHVKNRLICKKLVKALDSYCYMIFSVRLKGQRIIQSLLKISLIEMGG